MGVLLLFQMWFILKHMSIICLEHFLWQWPWANGTETYCSIAANSIVKMPLYHSGLVKFAMGQSGKNYITLQWRHNGRDDVSKHQPHHCLLNSLFRRRSKKTSKHRATGLCTGNSPVIGEFPAQMASHTENVSIWWRHHENSLETQLQLYQLCVTTLKQIKIIWFWQHDSY